MLTLIQMSSIFYLCGLSIIERFNIADAANHFWSVPSMYLEVWTRSGGSERPSRAAGGTATNRPAVEPTSDRLPLIPAQIFVESIQQTSWKRGEFTSPSRTMSVSTLGKWWRACGEVSHQKIWGNEAYSRPLVRKLNSIRRASPA
jgi:hypothetical protein